MPASSTRRTFLRKALSLLAASVAAAVAAPVEAARARARRPARAARRPDPPSKLKAVQKAAIGTTMRFELSNAPYPASGESYKDSSVFVYVPKHFRVQRDRRVDVILHFHGHRDTAAEAMARHQLREQLHASKQNAILVVPQGPVRAEDSHGGKLDRPGGLVRFLTELRKELQGPKAKAALGAAGIPAGARIGKVIMSAHSGGYRVVAMCLKHGGFNVSEVYLFDALYGEEDTYRDWIANTTAGRHKLISYYHDGSGTRSHNQSLMGLLKKDRIPYLHETREGQLTRRQFTLARAVFVKTALAHQKSTYKFNNLRDCLYASSLKRYVKSDWFEDAQKPREIDERK